MIGPAPFEAELDVPGPGMVGGLAGLHWVAAGSAWRGARWLVVTPEQRLPATLTASGAVDWLHFDWVMAHRESPDSCAVEIRSGRAADAGTIVRAAGASTLLRSGFDLGLLEPPRR